LLPPQAATRGNYIGVILAVVLSTVVSILVASLILVARARADLAQTEANRGKSSSVLGSVTLQDSAGSELAAPVGRQLHEQPRV